MVVLDGDVVAVVAFVGEDEAEVDVSRREIGAAVVAVVSASVCANWPRVAANVRNWAANCLVPPHPVLPG